MPKVTKKPSASTSTPLEQETKLTPPPEPIVDAIDILNGERYVRTFSQAIHGDNFKEIADTFLKNKPQMGVYTAVPSHTVTEVEVRFRERSDADLPIDKKDQNVVMVDRAVPFTDKAAAVAFGNRKSYSSVVVRKRR